MYERGAGGAQFRSDRTGRPEIWRMPSGGGEPIRLTRSGGVCPQESLDGKYLYYGSRLAVWRMPAQGGPEERVADRVPALGFEVAPTGIYMIRPGPEGGGDDIDFLDFASGKVTTVIRTAHPTFAGLSISPDERYLLYTQIDQSGSDLMLLEGFR